MTQPLPPSRTLESRSEVKGAGGFACLAFATVLGAAFWLGAVLASHTLIH